MTKLKLLMAAAACTMAAGTVSAQDHPVDSDKNIAAESNRARTVRDNQEAKLEQQRDATGAVTSGSMGSSASMGASSSMGSSAMGSTSMATGSASTDMSATGSASTSMSAGNMYSSSSPAATTRTVSNGPVADTPENRARYGQPMSRAGKRTAARGN
jgi:hypothetical protein